MRKIVPPKAWKGYDKVENGDKPNRPVFSNPEEQHIDIADFYKSFENSKSSEAK